MGRFWIDLENTPHVQFFQPLIEELESRGHKVLLTGRKFKQTEELAANRGLEVRWLGGNWQPKTKLGKIAAAIARSSSLLSFSFSNRIDLALNHGSRSQTVACGIRKIPVFTFLDFEHCHTKVFEKFCRHVLVPEATLPAFQQKERKHGPDDLFVAYKGAKEEVYVPSHRVDPDVLEGLGVPANFTIALLRPPASNAHYANAKSDLLFELALERCLRDPKVFCLLSPRDDQQKKFWQSRARPGKLQVLDRAVDGLSLIAAVDIVIGGGGTMNREAAVMGTPAYSVFLGAEGAMDRHLAHSGRLIMLRSEADLEKITMIKKQAFFPLRDQGSPLLKELATQIEQFANL